MPGTTWVELARRPELTEIDARLFGEDVAKELPTPYSLGDKNALRELFGAAGVADI